MRRGAALAAVLFATAITSALVVGGVFVARQQAAKARFGNRAVAVQPFAEEALVMAIASWDSAARATQLIGETQPLATSSLGPIAAEVWVTRTSTAVYWLVAEATSPGSPALRRRIGALVRVVSDTPRLVVPRAWSELP